MSYLTYFFVCDEMNLIESYTRHTCSSPNSSLSLSLRVPPQGHANLRELAYLRAFEALIDGNFAEAAKQWELVLENHPRDLLAIRSAHDAYIILGDVKNLQSSVA